MEAGMLPRTPAVGLARRRKAVCEHRLSEVDGEDDFAGVSSPSATFYPSFAQMEQILSPTGELLEHLLIQTRSCYNPLCNKSWGTFMVELVSEAVGNDLLTMSKYY